MNGQDNIPPAMIDAETSLEDGGRRTSKWDIRNAPKNYLWLMVYQGGAAVFAFAAVWLITQKTGKGGYGLVVAIIAASQIAQIFTNWTTVAVVKYGVEEFVEFETIARA